MLFHVCRWEFYFAYCEAAFDRRYLQDYQIVWQRMAETHVPPVLQQFTASASFIKTSGNGDLDTAAAATAQFSADIITMALFAVYCVLGGVVVARQPRMLLALITFVLGQASVKVCLPLMTCLLQVAVCRWPRHVLVSVVSVIRRRIYCFACR